MVEDAIGLVILAIAAVILLMVAGFGILFSFDLLSSSVSWIAGVLKQVGCCLAHYSGPCSAWFRG